MEDSIKIITKEKRARGWGQGGEMNQALYAHMNKKKRRKEKRAGGVTIVVGMCLESMGL
jgi:hypothetical protein